MATRLVLSWGLVVIIASALFIPPARAQSPIGGALATLAAATAEAQAVRAQQEATLAAQRATVMAMMIEQTRTAAQVAATATAISASATQSALDELNRQRSMTATAERDAIVATSTALAQSANATATSQAMNEQATREAYRATATSQAVMISAQATQAAQLSQTYATRQERFSWGLLVVEAIFVIGAAFVLWRLALTLGEWANKMRPQALPSIQSENIEMQQAAGVVIDQEKPRTPGGHDSRSQSSRLPSTVQVVDSPQMVAALDRWAERYDAKHGEATDGNS